VVFYEVFWIICKVQNNRQYFLNYQKYLSIITYEWTFTKHFPLLLYKIAKFSYLIMSYEYKYLPQFPNISSKFGFSIEFF
jgi:hypothetical protein